MQAIAISPARASNCTDITVESNEQWAADIARQVARRYHAFSQEREDLIADAKAKLCELIARRGDSQPSFDPSRAVDRDMNTSFRVWAYLTIRCTCVRALHRMRGGGCFKTVRPERVFRVGCLGDSASGIVGKHCPPEVPEVDPQQATVAQLRELNKIVKKPKASKVNAKPKDLGNKVDPRELLRLLRGTPQPQSR